MIVAGLTGNFGVGKSEAARMFKECGATVIDADRIGHECLKEDDDCIRKVKRQFGHEILTNGKIDRKKLGFIVFNDQQALRKLEEIVHPLIRKRVLDVISQAQQGKNGGVYIIEAAILIEAGWFKWMDKVILVKADEDLQIKRVQQRSKMSKEDVLKRLQVQYSVEDKSKYADYVIDNRTTKANLKKQVKSIYDELLAFY